MKTIQITIQIPDDANVVVNNGGQPNYQGQKEFTPRPDPEFPEGYCPECGNGEWRLIRAGTSKRTGKRYNAFYVCGTEGCNGKPGDNTRDAERDQLPF